MNWIQFLCWMLGIYSFYYSAIFLYDFKNLSASLPADPTQSISLAIPPAVVAEIMVDMASGPQEEEIDYFLGEEDLSPASFTSGGVSIRELFELARSESIEYTRGVSF